MQILVRTVHTVEQTVFWGWLSCSCCCATTGALVGARRKLWSSAVAVSLGRAMLGSTMDTCSASSRVAFGRIFSIFLVTGWTRILSVDILVVHCTAWPMRNQHVQRRQQWQWLAFPGFAYDATSRCVPRLPATFFFCSRAALGTICIFFYDPSVFSAFSAVDNFALVDFLGPQRATHSCECSRAGGAGVAGTLLPGDSAHRSLHN